MAAVSPSAAAGGHLRAGVASQAIDHARAIVIAFALSALLSVAVLGPAGKRAESLGTPQWGGGAETGVEVLERHFPPRYSAGLYAVVSHGPGATERREATKVLRDSVQRANPGARLAEIAHAPVPSSAFDPRAVSVFAVMPTDDFTSEELSGEMREQLPQGSSILLVGPAVLGDRISHSSEEAVLSAERIALPFAFCVALLAFSSLAAAVIPFLLGFVAMALVHVALTVMMLFLPLDSFATTITSVLALGLSIDFSLFMVSRYRAELARTDDRTEALRIAVMAVGRAIVVSSVAISGTLLCLMLVGLSSFTSMAIGGAVAVSVTALVSLTFLPALIALLGPHLDRFGLPRLRSKRHPRHWAWLADQVTSRPLAWLLVSVAVLGVLCLPIASLGWVSPSASDLPSRDPARQDLVRLQGLLGPGASGPIAVVTQAPPEATRQRIIATPGIAAVLPPVRGEEGWALVRAVASSPPEASGTRRVVSRLRQDLGGNRTTLVTGPTAASMDLKAQLEAGSWRLLIGMILVSALALVVGLRSVLVPLKAILGTVLSVGATLGVLAALDGLTGDAHPTMALVVPLSLAAVLFGLSIDYEVFLLTRIREEVDAGKATREAVRTGMSASARPIVLAALTLASVFAVLSLSSFRVFREFGLGVVIGILIDAVLVRCLFIPAATVLLGRWNWWLPGLPLEQGGAR